MSYNILDELTERGLVYQTTGADALREHLDTPRAIYCGYDPTGPSLQVGNLVPVLIQARFQQAGHTPIVVLGGATGQIGDPSGKSSERPLLDLPVIEANKTRQRAIFERLLRFGDGKTNDAIIVDNLDWLSEITLIQALRDTGKHFSVNEMIQRDAVKDRLSRQQGLSLTEFFYGVFQALDFQYLHKTRGVTVELGGSDQWSNIISGIDLVRRTSRATVYGFTCPLVTKGDGTKFGKTESGPVWVSADLTSAFSFYQFFLNVGDTEVGTLLRFLTFLSLTEIQEIELQHAANPGGREAQRALARHLTTFIHGAAKTRDVEEAAAALFNGTLDLIPATILPEALAGVPRTVLSLDELLKSPIPMAELLCRTVICESKREARELLNAGAVNVNGATCDAGDTITAARLLHGRFAAIRKGKRTWHLAVWE
jgi:tyrosyl-tRNA synthetase